MLRIGQFFYAVASVVTNYKSGFQTIGGPRFLPISKPGGYAMMAMFYGIAVVSVGVAVGLSLLFPDVFGLIHFILLLAAVLLSGWLGGFGPGVAATILGALANYFIIPVTAETRFLDLFPRMDLAVFAMTALVNTCLIAMLRRARKDLHMTRVAVQEALYERTLSWASIAHDLKNPLGAIALRTQLLQRRVSGGNLETDKLGEGLDQILDISRQASEMVSELVDDVKLDMGADLDLDISETDLVSLAEETVAETAASAAQQITLKAEVPRLVGHWDRRRSKRVLENLLSNAVKYSPGGGEILVRVSEEAQDGRRYAFVSVEDRGLGIPEKDMKHVFERFHRGENVRGRIAGAGLGLAGSREIVTAHGGAMRIESAEGQGTRVTVELPLDVDLLERSK